MHVGMNVRVLSDSRTQLSSARIRTRLGEGRDYASSPTNVDIAVPNALSFCSLLQRNNHELSVLRTRQSEVKLMMSGSWSWWGQGVLSRRGTNYKSRTE